MWRVNTSEVSRGTRLGLEHGIGEGSQTREELVFGLVRALPIEGLTNESPGGGHAAVALLVCLRWVMRTDQHGCVSCWAAFPPRGRWRITEPLDCGHVRAAWTRSRREAKAWRRRKKDENRKRRAFGRAPRRRIFGSPHFVLLGTRSETGPGSANHQPGTTSFSNEVCN